MQTAGLAIAGRGRFAYSVGGSAHLGLLLGKFQTQLSLHLGCRSTVTSLRVSRPVENVPLAQAEITLFQGGEQHDGGSSCPPIALGPIHFVVGSAEHVRGRFNSVPRGRADRARDAVGRNPSQSLDDTLDARIVRAGGQHTELVAAQARHEVAAATDRLGPPVGEPAEKAVTGRVALAIVHRLEVVYVDDGK